MTRGQLFSTDLVVAVAIAVAIWGVLVFEFARTETRYNDGQTRSELLFRGMQVTDVLLRTPGSPTAWDNATVAGYGLAERPYVLSTEKTGLFFSESIITIKERLNVAPHRLRVRLLTQGGDEVFVRGDIDEGARREIITIRRPVIYNGTSHLFETKLQS